MSRSAFIALAVGGISTAAHAGIVNPDDLFNVTVSFGDITWSSAGNPDSITSITQNDEGDFIVQGQWSTANWSSDWSFEIDPGSLARGGMLETGFVISSFNFTNTTGMDDSFSLSISTNVTQLDSPTLMTGSFSGALLSGNPGVNTAMLGVDAGEFLYNALADGAVVRTLVDDTFSASTNLTTSFGPFDFVDEPGPMVLNTLGITHDFTLTDGDTASFVGSFLVREIPAPGAATLFGLAGLAAARRRR